MVFATSCWATTPKLTTEFPCPPVETTPCRTYRLYILGVMRGSLTSRLSRETPRIPTVGTARSTSQSTSCKSTYTRTTNLLEQELLQLQQDEYEKKEEYHVERIRAMDACHVHEFHNLEIITDFDLLVPVQFVKGNRVVRAVSFGVYVQTGWFRFRHSIRELFGYVQSTLFFSIEGICVNVGLRKVF